MSTSSTSDYWTLIFAPLYWLCSFCQRWVGYIFVTLSSLCCLTVCNFFPWHYNYWSFILSAVIVWCQSSLFFSINIVLVILDLLLLPINFRIGWYPQGNVLRFWFALHWIYRSFWKEMTSLQYWVFLFTDIDYLSISTEGNGNPLQ